MKERIKIALAQISCKQGDKKENLNRIKEKIEKSKEYNTDLVIFPELSLTGYLLRDRVYKLAETIPGKSTIFLEKLARKTGTHLVFGMPEISGKTTATIYNTAILIGPEGILGKYRKMYLPSHSVFEEKRYFRPGYQPATFKTELGRIGLIICYDIFFPELCRLNRLKGSRLIICISASPVSRKEFFEILTKARAIENNSFVAYVNLVGLENGLQFGGGSRIIGPSGKVLVKAEYDEEGVVVGEINYKDIKPIETFVPLLKDIRPEIFDKLKNIAEKI
ncbi:MAG: carbon-nitrogen hydrolase family protein [Petrotogales bacterium]